MKRLPIGKQVFRDLIEGDFVYVDKTPWLVELAGSGIATFLSRPRRFGKSLTVSTFKEMFLGSRELFRGTFAYDNWDFTKTSPVVKLDMSVCGADTVDGVRFKIIDILTTNFRDNELEVPEMGYADSLFRNLISELNRKSGRVVVLIDEYDAPLLDALDKPCLAEIKDLLRGFYKVLKEQEENLRFVFITGISRFSKVGVFSALNNLKDITLSSKYSSIVGYTREEISRYFPEYITQTGLELELSNEGLWERMRDYYNGFSWDGKTFLYNPFSILRFFDEKQFLPFWMESGSPSFIVQYVKDKKILPEDIEGKRIGKAFVSIRDIDEASPESFLLQAGYLTIRKDIDDEYELGFPNFEVRHTFNYLMLTSLVGVTEDDCLGVKNAIRRALEANDTQSFVRQFSVLFSSIPAVYFQKNNNEYFYSSILYMYLTAAGFIVTAEKYSNLGRMDITLFWKKERAYIIELKMDSARGALNQIKAKNYAGQFAAREVVMIGLAIDAQKRTVGDFCVEVRTCN